MSAFLDDHAKDMKDPQFAYEFGRFERELEIIKLLEEHTINAKHGGTPHGNFHFWEMGMKYAIALIKGETK